MRVRTLALALVVSFTGLGLSACGSSKKASDTTVAAVETTAAADTTVAATEETAAAETTVAATETTVAETMAAGSTETTSAATGAVADATTAALVTQMLKGMNGGAEPSAADIACVSGKTKSEDLAALINAGSASPDPKTLLPLIKAIFGCKPAGLADSMSTSFDTMPAGVSAENKTCLANALLDILAGDDQLLELSLSSTGGIKDLPAADRKLVVDKLTPAVNKCIDPSMRAKVLEELNK